MNDEQQMVDLSEMRIAVIYLVQQSLLVVGI